MVRKWLYPTAPNFTDGPPQRGVPHNPQRRTRLFLSHTRPNTEIAQNWVSRYPPFLPKSGIWDPGMH